LDTTSKVIPPLYTRGARYQRFCQLWSYTASIYDWGECLGFFGNWMKEILMKKENERQIEDYNNDTHTALTKALSYGSLKRQRSTLAELAGLAANDNDKTKGE
tara:strand:- start:519 stop:827 length:309 start_codon:yes stop_codon:yes gene_type:complete